MLNYLSIMFGGALGTGARFWLSGFIAQRSGEFFPLGTLIVNVTGCFIIGVFAALIERAASRIHTAKILRLSMDLPMVIEIVDTEENVNSLLPALEEMMGSGLVTLEKVKVIHYRHVEN